MDHPSIQSEVILGVDTHLDTHVAAVISQGGRLLGTLAAPTNAAGYLKLLAWARSFGNLQRAGVEGTGTYGAGLTRVLRDHTIEAFYNRSRCHAKIGNQVPADFANQFYASRQQSAA